MKRSLFTILMIFSLFLLFSCDNEPIDDPVEVVFAPRYSEIKVIESTTKSGAIDIFIRALDDEATIYYVVVENGTKAPTEEEIKAGVKYGESVVILSGNNIGTVFTTLEGLEVNKAYDVHVTLFYKELFAAKIYSTTVVTLDEEAVLNKGSGTEEDPYKIFTIADLEKVGEDSVKCSAHYVLMNDIDLSEKYGPDLIPFTPLGLQSGKEEKFTGSFNGNGYTISNLYISGADNTPYDKANCGLFAMVDSGGSVMNLVLTNVNIITSQQAVGAVIGYSKGRLANIVVDGGHIQSVNISSSRAGGAVGWLVSDNDSTEKEISNVYTNIKITASGDSCGGIVGIIDASAGIFKPVLVSDCFSEGDVYSNNRWIGGIAGRLRGAYLTRSITTSNVTGTRAVGGVVGNTEARDGGVQPKITNVLALGTTVTATASQADQSESTGKVIGNHSARQVVLENIYSLDVTVLNALHTSRTENGTEATLENITDFAWLSEFMDIYSDGNWEIKESASRPSLKLANAYDEAKYETPLALTSVEVVNGTNRNSINISATANINADIYYLVVEASSTAPTKEQIIAGVNYGTVTVVTKGKVTGTTVTQEINDLTYSKGYDVYFYAQTADKEIEVVKLTVTTKDAPITLAIEAVNGDTPGDIVLTAIINKAATTYYYVTENLEETKTALELIDLDKKFTGTTFTITELTDGKTYKIIVVSVTEDEVSLVKSVNLEIPAVVEPLSGSATVTPKDTNQFTYVVEVTPNKSSTINYAILETNTEVTKDMLTEVASSNSFDISVTKYSTTYYFAFYLETENEESEIVFVSFTTVSRPALEVTANLELGVDEATEVVIVVTSNITGVSVFYIVQLATANAPTKEEVLAATHKTSLNISVSGLEGQSTYIAYVVVVDEDVTSELLTTTTVTTTELLTGDFRGENTSTYFPIYSASDLVLFAELFNGTSTSEIEINASASSLSVTLMNDIDLKDINMPSIGYSSTGTVIQFKGTFDGNFKTISNFKLENDNLLVGFITYLATGGIFKNVLFDQATIKSTVVNGSSDVGTAVAVAFNKGTVSHVQVSNSEISNANTGNSRVGGVIGKMNSGSATYLSVISSTVKGDKHVGGVIGHTDFTSSTTTPYTISNLYSNATVEGSGANVGGIVGHMRSILTNSVSEATVIGSNSALGSVVGYQQNYNANASAENGLLSSITSVISYKKPDANLKIVHASTSNGAVIQNGLYAVGYTPASGTAKTLEDITSEFVTSLGFDLTQGWVLNDGKLTLVIGGMN